MLSCVTTIHWIPINIIFQFTRATLQAGNQAQDARPRLYARPCLEERQPAPPVMGQGMENPKHNKKSTDYGEDLFETQD